jgi:hypothetical protein
MDRINKESQVVRKEQDNSIMGQENEEEEMGRRRREGNYERVSQQTGESCIQ